MKSQVLDERIPATLRDPDGNWFGFSTRARVIVYNKAAVKPADVPTYESLADPRNKGQVCMRSGSHPYNLSLVAALIAHHGEAKTEDWARGVVANFARAPARRRHRPDQGGGRRRVRRRARPTPTTTCALMRSTKPEEREMRREDGRRLAQPGDATARTSTSPGAGVLKHAPHRENARPVPRVPGERRGAGATSPTATTSGRW